MRADAHQAQRVIVGLFVDQHQVRPDVTVAKAAPAEACVKQRQSRIAERRQAKAGES
jgi:hypothetical protein